MSSTKSAPGSKPRGTAPRAEWSPSFFTERRYPTTDGDEIIQFAEAHFRVLKGFRAGEPLVFTDWQKWLLRCLYERNEEGRLRYRRALIGLPRKNGKSLMGSAIWSRVISSGASLCHADSGVPISAATPSLCCV